MKAKLAILALALSMLLAACDNGGESTESTSAESSVATTSEESVASEVSEEVSEESSEESTATEGGTELHLHRAYSAPNGDRGFGRFVVAIADDKIVDVAIDEFELQDAEGGLTGVPNSDGAFGEGFAEGKILASKLENNEPYSAMMAEFAGSTKTIEDNYQAIIDFAKGKTVAELEEVINGATPGEPVDAVTGATLANTVGYLQGIVDAAKSDYDVSVGTVEDLANVELKAMQGAPHGDRGFGDAVVAMEGDKIVVASIDEFQFSEGEGVPSSDGAFGEGYADPAKPLASKIAISDSYSANIAEKAGSTVQYKDNMAAIEDFAAGKTAAEVQETVDGATPGEAIDAVTGATLADTAGYLQMIIDATK